MTPSWEFWSQQQLRAAQVDLLDQVGDQLGALASHLTVASRRLACELSDIQA